jgi:hypothetical protein
MQSRLVYRHGIEYAVLNANRQLIYEIAVLRFGHDGPSELTTVFGQLWLRTEGTPHHSFGMSLGLKAYLFIRLIVHDGMDPPR